MFFLLLIQIIIIIILIIIIIIIIFFLKNLNFKNFKIFFYGFDITPYLSFLIINPIPFYFCKKDSKPFVPFYYFMLDFGCVLDLILGFVMISFVL